MSVKYKIKKFQYASTAAIYGNAESTPIFESFEKKYMSFYALTKSTGEEYIKLYNKIFNLDYLILRYSNVYGPRQSNSSESGVVSIFIDSILSNKDIYIEGDGNQTRDFIFVKDVSRSNYLACVSKLKNKIYNVSSNTEVSILELFNIMKFIFGYDKNPIFRNPRLGDLNKSSLSNDKIIKDLGQIINYSLEEGLKEYFEYLK